MKSQYQFQNLLDTLTKDHKNIPTKHEFSRKENGYQTSVFGGARCSLITF